MESQFEALKRMWASVDKATPVNGQPAAKHADHIKLGYAYDPETDEAGGEIRYEGERHLLVFGPNGSGKGTRLLMPNLLGSFEDRSVIVIDPKGEAAAISASHRRRLGHEVVIINPFNVLNLGSTGFNPLAVLDPQSPNFYDDAASLGEALITIQGNDPHWSESAQGLLVALIMWEKLRNGAKATLENVRAMLTEPDQYEAVELEDGKVVERLCSGLRITARQMCIEGGYQIASLASRFTESSRELSSIQSAADTQTRWLLSDAMRVDTEKNGVDFKMLKDKPTTVYVILPAERLRTHSVWLRLVIVSALRSLYKAGGKRTTLLIDEMAALGHLAPLEDAFGLVRGYRVQIAAIFQDLSQLKALYKERWETFVANAGAVFAFGPNDLTTAEWMSKRAGQTTVLAKGVSTSEGKSTSGPSQNSGISDQQIARPLYLPHELIGLEEGMGMLWLAGMANGIRFFAPQYAQIEACNAQADRNPYWEG